MPVIRQTHFLFLPGWNEKKKRRGKYLGESTGQTDGSEILGEGKAGRADVTFREEELLWLLPSDTWSKNGCRLGGAVTAWLDGGTPLVSR